MLSLLVYNLDLAWRSLARSKVLTALMVVAIAMGIGASMTTLAIYQSLAGDPIPGRSDHVYRVKLDARELDSYLPGQEPDDQVGRFDAESLLRDARGQRQLAMTGGRVAVVPENADPFFADARYTSADFFPMFGVLLRYGRAWSAADDAARERVVVLSASLNQRLYAGADSTGRSLRLGETTFRILGVLGDWRPVPHFYDLSVGAYRTSEDAFIPLSTSIELRLPRSGSTTCWSEGLTIDPTAVNAACSWIQYWVQLGSADAARAYRDYLAHYSEEQRATGRYARPTNVRLRPVMDYLEQLKVVPSDARLQVWLALGFLLVCLINTIGLLLAKCLRRSGEIGVRRALGASRRTIFAQFVIEAGLIGILGGVLGLLLAGVGLALVNSDAQSIAQWIPFDWPVLLGTFAIEIAATLVAGVLPAWRACQIAPALQLKSQ